MDNTKLSHSRFPHNMETYRGLEGCDVVSIHRSTQPIDDHQRYGSMILCKKEKGSASRCDQSMKSLRRKIWKDSLLRKLSAKKHAQEIETLRADNARLVDSDYALQMENRDLRRELACLKKMMDTREDHVKTQGVQLALLSTYVQASDPFIDVFAQLAINIPVGNVIWCLDRLM